MNNKNDIDIKYEKNKNINKNTYNKYPYKYPSKIKRASYYDNNIILSAIEEVNILIKRILFPNYESKKHIKWKLVDFGIYNKNNKFKSNYYFIFKDEYNNILIMDGYRYLYTPFTKYGYLYFIEKYLIA